MSIELSAEDRAAIEAIIGPRENKSLRDVLRDSLEHGVEYGIRAGLERGAKECAKQWRLAVQGKIDEPNADDCAAAIRALLEPK